MLGFCVGFCGGFCVGVFLDVEDVEGFEDIGVLKKGRKVERKMGLVVWLTLWFCFFFGSCGFCWVFEVFRGFGDGLFTLFLNQYSNR